MLKPSALIALALPIGLAACSDDPPAPSEVRARITDDLGHVLREGTAAGRGGAAAIHTDAALGLIERFGGPSTEAFAKRLPAVNLIANTRYRINSQDPWESDGSVAPATDFAIDTDQLIEELNTKLFTDANHVGDGIYRIPASFACDDDADCAQQFDKLELRVRTATDDDRLILALQAGANHDEPLRLALSHTSLAVTVDLDETGQAMTSLAPVLGEAPPNARLSGEITGQVDILGTANARFALTFGRPLDIAFAETGVALDGSDVVRFTSAAANVAALAFDAGSESGSVVIGLGATTLHLPADGDDEGLSPAIDLDLGGASLVAMLASNQPMQLTHVGLGERTTTLSVDGQRAVTIDLNPDDGRAFGATISHDPATGLDTISVSPKVDFNLSIDHAVLGDEPPLFDVTRVLLEGSLRTAGDRIEVMTGTFAVTTNPAEFGFSATAGQCVAETVDAWEVGTCE